MIVYVGTLSLDLTEVNIMDLIMKRRDDQRLIHRIRKEDCRTTLLLFAVGTFQPVIESVLPLEQAKAAHERIVAKQAFGMIALVPRSDV